MYRDFSRKVTNESPKVPEEHSGAKKKSVYITKVFTSVQKANR